MYMGHETLCDNPTNFYSLEVVDRVSETQLQVGENCQILISDTLILIGQKCLPAFPHG